MSIRKLRTKRFITVTICFYTIGPRRTHGVYSTELAGNVYQRSSLVWPRSYGEKKFYGIGLWYNNANIFCFFLTSQKSISLKMSHVSAKTVVWAGSISPRKKLDIFSVPWHWTEWLSLEWHLQKWHFSECAWTEWRLYEWHLAERLNAKWHYPEWYLAELYLTEWHLTEWQTADRHLVMSYSSEFHNDESHFDDYRYV